MTWTLVTNLKGPKGDQGDPGPPGADSTVPGPQGEPGVGLLLIENGATVPPETPVGTVVFEKGA